MHVGLKGNGTFDVTKIRFLLKARARGYIGYPFTLPGASSQNAIARGKVPREEESRWREDEPRVRATLRSSCMTSSGFLPISTICQTQRVLPLYPVFHPKTLANRCLRRFCFVSFLYFPGSSFYPSFTTFVLPSHLNDRCIDFNLGFADLFRPVLYPSAARNDEPSAFLLKK